MCILSYHFVTHATGKKVVNGIEQEYMPQPGSVYYCVRVWFFWGGSGEKRSTE